MTGVVTVSDLIAQFFEERGCRHAFGVVGAGNMRIFDAIQRLGRMEIICCHGEQAAAQAAIGYFRASSKIAPVLVTCGGGASNVVTGVISAWMDSIPLFVVAGQESRRNDKLRAYGVQGFSLKRMVEGVVNEAVLIESAYKGWQLDFADLYRKTGQAQMFDSGGGHGAYRNVVRPGPVVIEVPMDVQGMAV